MVGLIPWPKVAAIVAVLFGVLVALVAPKVGLDSPFTIIRWAAGIELVLGVIAGFAWRFLWRWIPMLRKFYPDLNGTWDVELHYQWKEKRGTVEATAHIEQSLTALSINMVSSLSDSNTLAVVAKKEPESGRPMLYYTYHNEPQQGTGGTQAPHKGTAILKLSLEDDSELKGNYFTDRETKGHFIFRRNDSAK